MSFLRIICFYFLACGALLLGAADAHAASIYLSPQTGVYAIDDVFTVSVMVDSADIKINVAEGVLSFNAKELRAIKTDTGRSFFSMWAEQPGISNNEGAITFSAGSPKSFSEKGGNVFSATFRVLMPAPQSTVHFSSAAVLAADGKASNVLSLISPGVYTLIPKTVLPEAEGYVASAGAPSAPVISSGAHAVPGKWYADENPSFRWDVAQDTLAVRIAADHDPGALPKTAYEEPIAEKTFADMEDGMWHVHVQLKNTNGWGHIAHFPFFIDTAKPERFDIDVYQKNDFTNPKTKFLFSAFDGLSGIDYYDVQIDNGVAEIWTDDGSGIYESRALDAGKHVLVARAVDKAGNYIVNSLDFEIQSLAAPVIATYTREVRPGDIFAMSGTSKYPDASAVVWMQQNKQLPQSYAVPTDTEGNFVFFSEEKLPEGVYRIWATIEDARGAKSTPSDAIVVAVMPSGFVRLGSLVIDALSITSIMVALVILLLIMIVYGFRKVMLLKKSIKKETAEAETAVRSAFEGLQKDIARQLSMLDRIKDLRELTIAEKLFTKKFKAHLDSAQRSIDKEVKDIEKKVE